MYGLTSYREKHRHVVLFEQVELKHYDEDMMNFLKYLINFFFYRFGLEQGGKSGSWILRSCGPYRILWIHLDPLDPMDPFGSFQIL